MNIDDDERPKVPKRGSKRKCGLTITTEKLPTGFVGSDYTAHLTATGGVRPYHWSVIAGELPRGLELDGKTGEIRGTPTEFAEESLLLRVEDSTLEGEQDATATLPLEVIPDGLMIVTEALPEAILGKPYTFKLRAAGGTEPYTWSITEGSLPFGLKLQPQSGVIHGKPTQGGTSVFIVQVTDLSTPPVSVALRFSP